MTDRDSGQMTLDEAAAYVQEVLTVGAITDKNKFTEALQVIGQVADENPENPVAGLFTLGLQLAVSTGLSPTFSGDKLILVPTLSQGNDQTRALAQQASGVESSPTTTTPSTDTATASTLPSGTPLPGAGNSAGQDLLGIAEGPPPPALPAEEVETTTPAATRSPIGVPRGYTTPEPTIPTNPNFTGRSTPLGPSVSQLPPRYFDGDQSLPASLDPVAIRRLQGDLVRAGILESGTFQPGFWDMASEESYLIALAYANKSGDNVQTVLAHLASLPKPKTDEIAEELSPRQVRQFVPPDPATLAQEVKSAFRQRLGREPTPEEVRAMAAELGGFTRSAFDQETAIMEGQFQAEQEDLANRTNAAVAASDPNFGGGTTAVGIVPRPTVEDDGSAFVNLPAAGPIVDPAARFLELFDQRYGPEMRRNEAVTAYGQTRQSVMASLLNMQSMIG